MKYGEIIHSNYKDCLPNEPNGSINPAFGDFKVRFINVKGNPNDQVN